MEKNGREWRKMPGGDKGKTGGDCPAGFSIKVADRVGRYVGVLALPSVSGNIGCRSSAVRPGMTEGTSEVAECVPVGVGFR